MQPPGQQARQRFGMADGVAIELQALAIVAIADDHATIGGPAGNAHRDGRGERAIGVALHRIGHGLASTTAQRQGGHEAGKGQGRGATPASAPTAPDCSALH